MHHGPLRSQQWEMKKDIEISPSFSTSRYAKGPTVHRPGRVLIRLGNGDLPLQVPLPQSPPPVGDQ